MSNTEAEADILYNVPAIARHMGLRPPQVHHQIRKGGLPAFRMGGVICARKSSIAAWLAEKEANARKPEGEAA